MADAAADGAVPFPLWSGGEDFARLLDAVISQPFEHPERFHPEALPIRRLVAIYGAVGAQKRRVLETYCRNVVRCPQLHIRVRPGALDEARKAIDDCMPACAHGTPYGVDAVVVVSHAQYMQRDAHALTWHAKAKAANVVLVALLDAVPGENPEFKALFHKAVLYLRPPEPASLRVAQMRWHVYNYLRECGGAVRFELSDDEWTQLGDLYTKTASPRQLKHYVQALIYWATSTGNPVTFAAASSSPFVTSTGGEGLHIVARPLNTEENALSQAAGLGPIHGVPRIQPQPRAVKRVKVADPQGGDTGAEHARVLAAEPSSAMENAQDDHHSH